MILQVPAMQHPKKHPPLDLSRVLDRPLARITTSTWLHQGRFHGTCWWVPLHNSLPSFGLKCVWRYIHMQTTCSIGIQLEFTQNLIACDAQHVCKFMLHSSQKYDGYNPNISTSEHGLDMMLLNWFTTVHTSLRGKTNCLHHIKKHEYALVSRETLQWPGSMNYVFSPWPCGKLSCPIGNTKIFLFIPLQDINKTMKPCRWIHLPCCTRSSPGTLLILNPKAKQHMSRFSCWLLTNNKSMLFQPTCLSQVNHVTNQIEADMNN
jgi:hypothetical protein